MPKRGVAFIKPEEPKFLKKMKEQMGYQEPDTVETKRQSLPLNKDDEDIQDDEKPVIVALKPGDLTEAEFEKEMTEKDESSKKITFNKPIKRDNPDENPLISTSRRGKEELSKRVKDQNETRKKVKNASLLSFDEEENDDG